MHLMSCIFLLLLASCKAISNNSTENPYFSFMIVPTYLTSPPPLVASVIFGKVEVNLGNYIEYYLAAYPPYVRYNSEPQQLYTLVVVDLDLPCVIAPYQSPYLIQLIVNIPGNDISAGDAITAWIPPSPPPGSGFHRYLFLVYRQTVRINPNYSSLLALPSDLTKFSLYDFSKRYKLGTPVAGNFFISRMSLCDDQSTYDQSQKEVQKCM